MTLHELETPCLVLDKAKVKKNISSLHKRMKELGVNLRPHGKTAKNIEVVRMALEGQSGGITVSTLKEAEYYFEQGISDLTYAVGIAPVKLNRVASLIRKGAALTLILDSVEQVRCVSAKAQLENLNIPVLIELDCDGHRSGVSRDSSRLLEIGRLIDKEHGVTLQGVLTHAGESYHCRTTSEIRDLAGSERDVAVEAAKVLRQNGLPCPTVSVGSTPTAFFAGDLTGVTEVRAGVFMFHDLVMAGLGVCQLGDIAISVLTSVIGHQKKKGWVITDAGWMALSRDRGTASQEKDQGLGLVCTPQGEPLGDLIVSSANQEHGILTTRDGESDDFDPSSLAVGNMVRILPNHACATAAMHDRYHLVDETLEVVGSWHRINGW